MKIETVFALIGALIAACSDGSCFAQSHNSLMPASIRQVEERRSDAPSTATEIFLTVSGLDGKLILRLNGTDDFHLSMNGKFRIFLTGGLRNSDSVKVQLQPSWQFCDTEAALGSSTQTGIGIAVRCAYSVAAVSTVMFTSHAARSPKPLGTAWFDAPWGVAVGPNNVLVVAERGGHRLRKISSRGKIITFAGNRDDLNVDGRGMKASFAGLTGVTLASTGEAYVTQCEPGGRVRKVSKKGKVRTFAGDGTSNSSDGKGLAAQFTCASAVTVDGHGNLYVTELGHLVRRITPAGIVTTLAGSGAEGFSDGVGSEAKFSFPFGIAVDPTGDLFISDMGNNRIRKIAQDGKVSTFAGTGIAGSVDGDATIATFDAPSGIAVDPSGNVFVSDTKSNLIRRISPSGVVMTLAGQSNTKGASDGLGSAALFNSPSGIAIDADGNVYVADAGNNRIRKITPSLPSSR